MASRLRIGAALLGATVALSFSAFPAAADIEIKPDRGGQQEGHSVWLENGPDGNVEDPNRSYGTSLIKLRIVDQDEVKVFAYCVELPTELKDGRGLKEAPWGQHPNPKSKFPQNSGKINWILHNSFPTVPVEKLGDDVDVKEAIAATQAAIWHFSDGAVLNTDKVKNDDIVKLYEKLTESAQDLPQPKASLDIEPSEKKGKAGERIGPFTVTTTADKVELSGKLPSGVKLTDKDGNPLAGVSDGDFSAQAAGDKVAEFFVDVPKTAKPGEAKMRVAAEATLDKGRLFIETDSKERTQSLVVAQPVKVKLKADAQASWEAAPVEVPPSSSTQPTTPTTETTPPTTTTTPAPAPGGGASDDDLASTGASIFVPLGIGIVLVGAGAGALIFLRRKKSSV